MADNVTHAGGIVSGSQSAGGTPESVFGTVPIPDNTTLEQAQQKLIQDFAPLNIPGGLTPGTQIPVTPPPQTNNLIPPPENVAPDPGSNQPITQDITNENAPPLNGPLSDIPAVGQGQTGGYGTAANGLPGGTPPTTFTGASPTPSTSFTPAPDLRVRIRAYPAQRNTIYGDQTIATNPMIPLYKTDGLVFPYTPNITVQGQTEYGNLNMTHVNQDFLYFIRAHSYKISITGEFTAQTNIEAQYLLACFHFLRSNSKMRFGADDKRGLAPPVLLLDGFGDYIFNALPVMIENWSFEYSNTVDLVEVQVGAGNNLANIIPNTQITQLANITGIGQNLLNPNITNVPNTQSTTASGSAWVPAKTNITISLIVQQTPKKWLTEFNLDKFRTGQLFGKTGRGWF